MGIGVIVHGYIECPGYAPSPATKRVYRSNRRVIRGLPISDADWPFITRDMFSFLPLRPMRDRQIPQYENQVIHFAGDYKNMYVLEADWVRKFEGLLSRLCWYRAVVILEFSALRYEWEVPFEHFGDRYELNPPRPPTQWAFRCYRLERQPLPVAEAVDGPLASAYHFPVSDVALPNTTDTSQGAGDNR
jgi:hypothetical protein